jgi:hypothetical protein
LKGLGETDKSTIGNQKSKILSPWRHYDIKC